MRCPTLAELPPPPPGRTGWPWTEETPQAPDGPHEGGVWPKISIVTPSFNQGDYIEKTIRSVLLQGYPNLEYIVIDGRSTDKSVEVLKKYKRWLAYWVSETDRGHGEAINKGVARATGAALAIMPSDDFYYPTALLTLIQLRALHPEAVCWVGACPPIDTDGKMAYPGKPFIRDVNSIGDWGHAAYLGCPSALFDMAAFRHVGGIDERFKTQSDVELWVRLAKVGSFAIMEKEIAEARFVRGSLTNRDQLERIAALIAINYVHGYRDVAKAVLARYSNRGIEGLSTAALAMAVARRLQAAAKRRLERILRGRSK